MFGLTSVDVDIYTISRDCIEVPTNDPEYADGCQNDLPSNAQNVIKNFFSSISLGDMTFDGEACYSSEGRTDTYIGSASKTTHTLTIYITLICAFIITVIW